MNWNGKQKNGILAMLTACREEIAVVKQRGCASEEAAWLLEKVNPEEQTAALIGLVSPMTIWANSLPDEEREKWLLYAMQNFPYQIRQWLGYTDDWTMMPAEVCKNLNTVVRITRDGHLPELYLIPATPREKDLEKAGPITLENCWVVTGIQLQTVTYMLRHGQWYKVYYPKLPSKSAVNRAIRLYLLSAILERPITSTNDMMVYELFAIKNSLLYNGHIENGIGENAARMLFQLVIEPGLTD